MVSDSDLVTRLREILRESDLDTATAGSVRKQLEKDFNVDLFDKKGFVRDQIDIYLETLNQDNEKQEPQSENENDELQEDEDGSQNSRRANKADKKVKKRGGGFQTVCNLSPQLQKVLGESKLARTEVVKKLWVYIKENNLQDPENKRNIVCDELLHAVFRVKSINMFQMNKALTKHIWPITAEDENSNHEMECEDGDDSVSVNAESSKAEEKGEEKKDGDDSVSIGAESLKEEKEEGKEDDDDSLSISAESLKEEKEEEKEDGDDSVSINDESSKEEKEEEKEGEQEEEEEEEEEQEGNARGSRNKRSSKVDKDVKKRRGGGFTKLCSLSPQLQAFIGEPELARTEVVKRLWAYIREKNLQDPKDKRNILCDESLHDLFCVKSINMFQMNKALSKHIWPLGETYVQSDSAKTERKSKEATETTQTDSAKKKRKSKQARETDADEPKQKAKKQKKGTSGFLAPLTLSDALVKFFATGENALSRADVVKKMWEYIKQNDLQDPSDKRRILCDDKLKELFEVDSFNGFSMTKLLTTHLIKMEQ